MPEEIRLVIDGREVTARPGEKLLWVALENGIYIPHLCAVKEAQRPAASCRLCFVEVEGYPHPVTSCTLEVAPGMVVRTRSERVDRLVRTGLELLLSNHRLGCGKCPKNRACELQRIARERGLKLKVTRLRSLPREFPVDTSPANFTYDPSRCVLCGKCVYVDHKVVGVGAIGFIRRGMERRVATFGEVPLAESRCTQCGACVEACPVGALAFKEGKTR